MTQSNLLFMGTFLLAIAACSPQKNQGDKAADLQSKGDGIIGGVVLSSANPISKNIVVVYDNIRKGLCTGSLINNNLVITAAHCVPADKSQLFVIFTADIKNAKSAEDLQIRQADKAEVSPYWATRHSALKDHGDIALIHYQGSTPKDYVPSTLLLDAKLLQKGTPVILAGYGISNSDTHEGSGILRVTYVTMEDPAYALTEVKLNQTQGRGACHGDSGGPAYVFNKAANSYLLFGVTSRGLDDPEDSCSTYSIYTNILPYAGWLKEASKRLTTSLRDLVPQL